VHDTDSADHAVNLVRRTALTEGLHAVAAKPVLHGDNGATLKATTSPGCAEFADSDEGGHLFQSDPGHHSSLMAAS
jgi:hypothetical protein